MHQLATALEAEDVVLGGGNVKKLDALPPHATDAPAPASRPDAPVRLERASFTYPGRTAPALADIDLTFSPGERLAVVGPSGAGKTTLARLLLRFDRPQSGRLLHGDTDVAGRVTMEVFA